jgi:nucleotide-binding universal stress UspA family protein
MGGYHRLALLEWLAGSPPDYVLGHIQLPVLIA